MAEQRAKGRWILSCVCKPRITMLCEFISAALARGQKGSRQVDSIGQAEEGRGG
jgi:hypothetical protein